MSFIAFEIKVKYNKLRNAPEAIKKLASEVIYESAQNIQTKARQLVPVRTGNLRDSIRIVAINDLEAAVEVGADYGLMVELGTRHQAAQPYLIPAYNSQKSNFESDMAEVLNPDNWSLF